VRVDSVFPIMLNNALLNWRTFAEIDFCMYWLPTFAVLPEGRAFDERMGRLILRAETCSNCQISGI